MELQLDPTVVTSFWAQFVLNCWGPGVFEGGLTAGQCHILSVFPGEVPSQVVLELTDEATERPAEVAVSQLDISGRRESPVFFGWGGELSCFDFFFLDANKAWVGWMLWRDFWCCFLKSMMYQLEIHHFFVH